MNLSSVIVFQIKGGLADLSAVARRAKAEGVTRLFFVDERRITLRQSALRAAGDVGRRIQRNVDLFPCGVTNHQVPSLNWKVSAILTVSWRQLFSHNIQFRTA
jgi:hypothetical protein